MSWSGDGKCHSCEADESHLPTIALAIALALLVAAVSGASYACCCSAKKEDDEHSAKGESDEPSTEQDEPSTEQDSSSWFAEFAESVALLYRVGQIKLFTLLLMSQVLSQFVYISDSTGEDSALMEPAASLVQGMALTNLDVLGVVPMGCVLRNVNTYHVLLFKTLSPLAAVCLIWTYPLWRYLRRDSYDEARLTAARISLVFIELLLPMISTSIAEIWQCSTFEDGSYMRVELTLPCDDSAQRHGWVAVASISLIVYPIGACNCFETLRPNQHTGRLRNE